MSIGEEEQRRAFEEWWEGQHPAGHVPRTNSSLLDEKALRLVAESAYAAGTERGLSLRGCCRHGDSASDEGLRAALRRLVLAADAFAADQEGVSGTAARLQPASVSEAKELLEALAQAGAALEEARDG